MLKRTTFGLMKTEKQYYAELGDLVLLVRLPDREALVKEIVSNASLSVKEKVRLILDVDKGHDVEKVKNSFPVTYAESSLVTKKSTATDLKSSTIAVEVISEATSHALAKKGIFSPVHVISARRDMLKESKPVSFLTYWLSERSGLIDWALSTEMLEVPLLGVGPVLSKSSQLFYKENLLAQAKSLWELVVYVEAEGVHHLTPLEYNLVIEFKKVVQLLRELELSSEGLAETFPQLKKHFFLCISRTEYLNIIQKSLNKMLALNPKFSEVGNAAEESVRFLLSQALVGLNLYNFILAICMTQSRRLLSLEDLFEAAIPGLINNYSFECPPVIKVERDHEVSGYLKRLELATAKKKRIEALKEWIDFVKGRPNFQVLKDFLARHGILDDVFLFDDNNLAPTLLSFSQIFISGLSSFLQFDITVDSKQVSLFEPELFGQRLLETSHSFSKLGHLISSDLSVKLPRTHLDLFRATNVEPSQDMKLKREMVEEIRHLSKTLAQLGDLLVEVLLAQKEPLTHTETPISQAAFLSGNAVLPWAKKMVEKPYEFRGEQVFYCLRLLSKVIHSLALWLGHGDYVILLGEEEHINLELAEVKEALAHMMPAEHGSKR